MLSTLSGPVTAAFVIRTMVCAPNDQQFLTQLISLNIFMAGFCTILQVSIGVRSECFLSYNSKIIQLDNKLFKIATDSKKHWYSGNTHVLGVN